LLVRACDFVVGDNKPVQSSTCIEKVAFRARFVVLVHTRAHVFVVRVLTRACNFLQEQPFSHV